MNPKHPEQIAQAIRHFVTCSSAALPVMMMASVLYTYRGVLVFAGGSENWWLCGTAAGYAVAVGFASWAFYRGIFELLPLVRSFGASLALISVIGVGLSFITSTSSVMNVAYLAGPSAIGKDLEEAVDGNQTGLNEAHSLALAIKSLAPTVREESARFRDMSEGERTRGLITGSPGEGAVTALLDQVASRLDALNAEINRSVVRIEEHYSRASQHLKTMKTVVLSNAPLNQRQAAFADQTTALLGAVAAMQGENMAPAIRRTAETLSAGIVLPAVSAQSEDLATRQREAFNGVEAAILAAAQKLEAAAIELAERPMIVLPRYTAPNAIVAVARQWRSYLPAWAGAIGIDWMPLLFALILALAHRMQLNAEATVRREAEDNTEQHQLNLPLETTRTNLRAVS